MNHRRNQVRVSVVERNGKVIHAESDEALREYQAVRALSAESARRRVELWGDGGRDAMARLCALFPALREAPGAAPWDATAMLRYACGTISHGEELAARFVLSVWNCNTDWNDEAHKDGFLGADDRLRRFDVFEALGVWDFAHRDAFLTWARDPFWP